MKLFVLALATVYVLDVIARLLDIWREDYRPPTPATHAFNAVCNVGIAIGLFTLLGQL